MSEYTPDEEQVREQYTQEQPPQIGTVAEKSAEFDRFLAKINAAPLTLDSLCEAWENADRLRGCNPGDTLIERLDTAYTIYRADYSANAQELPDTIRILHRAPQPQPWQALADAMEELYDGYSLRAAEAAQFLHERGVRVVGGDES